MKSAPLRLEEVGTCWIVPLGTVRVPIDGVKVIEVEFTALVVFVAVSVPFVIADIEEGNGAPEGPVLILNGVEMDAGCVAVFVKVVEGGGVGGTRVSLVRVGTPDGGLDSGGDVSVLVTVREEDDAGDENGGGIDVDASIVD
jgi:hypothetical protein